MTSKICASITMIFTMNFFCYCQQVQQNGETDKKIPILDLRFNLEGNHKSTIGPQLRELEERFSDEVLKTMNLPKNERLYRDLKALYELEKNQRSMISNLLNLNNKYKEIVKDEFETTGDFEKRKLKAEKEIDELKSQLIDNREKSEKFKSRIEEFQKLQNELLVPVRVILAADSSKYDADTKTITCKLYSRGDDKNRDGFDDQPGSPRIRELESAYHVTVSIKNGYPNNLILENIPSIEIAKKIRSLTELEWGNTEIKTGGIALQGMAKINKYDKETSERGFLLSTLMKGDKTTTYYKYNINFPGDVNVALLGLGVSFEKLGIKVRYQASKLPPGG